jgi:hypothetical protein
MSQPSRTMSRREVLVASGFVLAHAGLSGGLSLSAQVKAPLKIGLIGSGRCGPRPGTRSCSRRAIPNP